MKSFAAEAALVGSASAQAMLAAAGADPYLPRMHHSAVSPRHAYVHVPFCVRRCAYCDFAIAVRRVVPVDEYLDALRVELGQWSSGRVETLYFGGGTPSLLGAEGVRRMIELVTRTFELENGAEVTLEANPDDITRESAAAWRDAGINRLSIGAQTFHDPALTWMHRSHDSARIEGAFEAARFAGITNLSLDLIFALPETLGRSWSDDLQRAVALRPDHISLYGLTVESATPLARWVERGGVIEAPEDRYAADFLEAHGVLTGAGYEHYEVSNYALPNRRSRHNSSYWRRVPYAGLGPSAHSFDGVRRWWNVAAYAEWVRRLTTDSSAVREDEQLTPDSVNAERVYLGLRTDSGVVLDEFTRSVAEPWLEAGWAVADGDVLRLTPEGWLRLDAIAAALTHVGSHY